MSKQLNIFQKEILGGSDLSKSLSSFYSEKRVQNKARETCEKCSNFINKENDSGYCNFIGRKNITQAPIVIIYSFKENIAEQAEEKQTIAKMMHAIHVREGDYKVLAPIQCSALANSKKIYESCKENLLDLIRDISPRVILVMGEQTSKLVCQGFVNELQHKSNLIPYFSERFLGLISVYGPSDFTKDPSKKVLAWKALQKVGVVL